MRTRGIYLILLSKDNRFIPIDTGQTQLIRHLNIFCLSYFLNIPISLISRNSINEEREMWLCTPCMNCTWAKNKRQPLKISSDHLFIGWIFLSIEKGSGVKDLQHRARSILFWRGIARELDWDCRRRLWHIIELKIIGGLCRSLLMIDNILMLVTGPYFPLRRKVFLVLLQPQKMNDLNTRRHHCLYRYSRHSKMYYQMKR